MSTQTKPDVRLLRTAAGLTQQQLAFTLGTAIASIVRWEHGAAISPMGRRLLETWASQPRVLRRLLSRLTPQELAAALGYPPQSPTDGAPPPSSSPPPAG